jgi:HD-GYP domain-containing protein (c-di-GMP phosphodiesterase class II)
VDGLKISVMDLHVGDRTGADIFTANGLLVVTAHTVLNAEDIEKFHRHRLDYVDIMLRYDGSIVNDDQPGIKEMPAAAQQMASYQEVVDVAKMLFQAAETTGTISKSQFDDAFSPLAKHLQKETDVVSLLLTLHNEDEYTYQHCAQVGMLSYYIAKWLGYPENEAAAAGKAGYLVDIGNSYVSKDILMKPGPLTNEEFEEVKTHTQYGHDIIKASELDHDSALVALQHHERLDGSGYPFGLKEEEIHPLAKIVAVADIYSAMISDRVYRKKKDLLYVLRELHRLSFGQLDPKVTQVFIRNIVPNFIGKRVLLSSGESGQIVMMHPVDFFKPLVQMKDRFVNLTEHPELEVVEVYI